MGDVTLHSISHLTQGTRKCPSYIRHTSASDSTGKPRSPAAWSLQRCAHALHHQVLATCTLPLLLTYISQYIPQQWFRRGKMGDRSGGRLVWRNWGWRGRSRIMAARGAQGQMQGRVRWTPPYPPSGTGQGGLMYQHPDQVGEAGGEEIKMRFALLQMGEKISQISSHFPA